jgi:hypothetical protein
MNHLTIFYRALPNELRKFLRADQGYDRVNDYVLPYLGSLITVHPQLFTNNDNEDNFRDILSRLFAKGMYFDLRIWTFILGVLDKNDDMTIVVWNDLIKSGLVDEKAVEVYCKVYGLVGEERDLVREEVLGIRAMN